MASRTHAAASTYLEGLSLSARRDAGQVYTPPHLVEFVLDLVGYLPTAPLERWLVLDPACGAGAFLEEAVRRLAKRLELRGVDLRLPAGHRELAAAVERCLHGLDVDDVACRLARNSLREAVSSITGRSVPGRLFETSVRHADYLMDRRWIYPSSSRRSGFDLIVGNPPYVAIHRLSENRKKELRTTYATAEGRLDLYQLFFERSLELLTPGGRLAFITPDKFFTSHSARRLRELITREGSIRTVAEFRSHKVFKRAATVPCVTIIKKGRSRQKIELLECRVDASDAPVTICSRSQVTPPRPGDSRWQIVDAELQKLSRSITSAHPVLADRTRRISAGIATGRDRVFVLPRSLADRVEPELRRPAIRGQDIAPCRLDDPRLEIIIPYIAGRDGRPELIDLAGYPLLAAYLAEHRSELEKRYCVREWRKRWYDLHDPWTEDVSKVTKVLVPDIAVSNRFALDQGEFCPLHSVYYLIPCGIAPELLVAVLNSAPVEFLMRLNAPVVKDGFRRYRKQFLATLPVPVASSQLEREILSASGDRERTESLIARLFTLSESELKGMRRFLDSEGPHRPGEQGACPARA